MKNIHYDAIFSDFVTSAELDVSVDKLEEEIYTLKSEITHSCTRSGRNSFQTNWVYNMPFDELTKLKEKVVEFTNQIVRQDYNMEVDECSYWINVNPPNAYNVIHMHGSVELIGTFYVKVGNDSGTLEIVRNDGAVYNKIGRQSGTFKCDCEVGRFYLMPGHLWHHVTNNYSEEDRLSVSYNIRLK